MSIGDMFFTWIGLILHVAFWILIYKLVLYYFPVYAIHYKEIGVICGVLC